MNQLPLKLSNKLIARQQNNALRQLPLAVDLIDFASNDYLGFSKSNIIFDETHRYLLAHNSCQNGATGSRLLSGNHKIYAQTETLLAEFHQSESALIFNSGYDANVGFFGAVPQKGDLILYDELCHASIRDGIQLSNATSYKFQHNNYNDLERLLLQKQGEVVYIVTESVFSMDGDTPNLEQLVAFTKKYPCYLVIDEAHALGVFGEKGEGLVQSLQLQEAVFARIMTFGKGLGCHGAAILGSAELKNYLINFARSFIYTTGLSPHSVATIFVAYNHLIQENKNKKTLKESILYFNQKKNQLSLNALFVQSKSAIQSAIIPGNKKAKSIAKQLQEKGFDVKPILSPTVPEGQERLRFCLHSFNTLDDITAVLDLLHHLVFDATKSSDAEI